MARLAAIVRPKTVVLVAAAGWALVFAELAGLQYRWFLTRRFDLGNMTQAFWSTAHGHVLEVTEVGGEQITRLGVHVDPLLVVLAPLWWLWPSPALLGALQAASVALGAIPVFWLARKHLASERTAVVLALAYLAYPPLEWKTLNEFHPTTFAISLLLFAIWYLDEDRLRMFAIFAALCAASQEEIGLLIAGLGVWYVHRHRRWAVGLTIALLGAAWTAVSLRVIIPHFSGGPSPFYGRYAAVGGSPAGIATTFIKDPFRIADAVFTAPNLILLVVLTLPVLGLFLRAPALALVALPQLALSLMSGRASDHTIDNHLTSPVIAIFFAATVLGVAKLGSRATFASWCVLAAALLCGLFYGPARLTSQLFPRQTDARLEAMRQAVQLVPTNAPVAATSRLASHLSARRRVFSFPNVARASWATVDTRDMWLPSVRGSVGRRGLAVPGIDGAVAPARFRAELKRLEQDPKWHRVYSRQSILVFRRS